MLALNQSIAAAQNLNCILLPKRAIIFSLAWGLCIYLKLYRPNLCPVRRVKSESATQQSYVIIVAAQTNILFVHPLCVEHDRHHKKGETLFRELLVHLLLTPFCLPELK